MNRFALAVSLLAVSAVSASAADLAARPYTKAPPVVVTVYDWSGFYLGANGGGAWSRKCWDANPFTIDLGIIPPFTVSGPEGCHTASGATAGGQVGYRWQRAAWVFGLEAQGNWADLSGSNPTQNAFLAGFANRSRIDAIGLFTGAGRLLLEFFPALREGRRGGHAGQVRNLPHGAAGSAAHRLHCGPWQ
jgi:outer membrane immunogenic protein